MGIARAAIDAFRPAAGRAGLPKAVLLALAALSLVLAGCSGAEKPEQAPLFSLPNGEGRQVALAPLLQEGDAVVLVFYRGFF